MKELLSRFINFNLFKYTQWVYFLNKIYFKREYLVVCALLWVNSVCTSCRELALYLRCLKKVKVVYTRTQVCVCFCGVRRGSTRSDWICQCKWKGMNAKKSEKRNDGYTCFIHSSRSLLRFGSKLQSLVDQNKKQTQQSCPPRYF